MRIVETGGGLGDPWTLQLVSETGWRCGLSPNFTSLSSDLEDSSRIPSNHRFLGLFSPSVCPLHSCQSVFLRHIWFHTCHLNWLPRTLLVINSLLMEFNVQPRLGLPGRKLDHPRDPAWPSLWVLPVAWFLSPADLRFWRAAMKMPSMSASPAPSTSRRHQETDGE